MFRLGVGQKPVVMPAYPHLLAEDTAIWTKFLESKFARLTRVWYDVHVGGSVKPVDEADELSQRIAAGLTRKRIDVVAAVGAGYWIIEIKPFAGMTAFGQIVNYTALFIREYRVVGEIWPVIVCDRADEDVLPQAEAMGVVVIEV